MKFSNKILTAITLSLLTSSAMGKEADKTHLSKKESHPVFIKVHPFSLGFEGEYGVNEHFNVGTLGSFYNYNIDKTSEAQSASAGLSATYFTTSNISDSGYVKGLLEYTDYSFSVKEDESAKKEKIRQSTVSGTALVGYQWVYDSGIMLNSGIGMQVAQRTVDADGKSKGTGVLPAGELAVGFRF